MKIAIDSGPTVSGHAIRGIGTYTTELIQNLNKLESRINGLHINAFDFSKESKLLYTGYDVVHFTAFSMFTKSLPNKLPENSIVTIHDMIPLIYPKQYPGGIRGNINWYRQKRILKQASAVIVNSETTKKDVLRFLDVNPSKIYVTHLAHRSFIKKVSKLGLSKIRNKLRLPNHFVLYVGDINYNKNLISLIKVCKQINTPLVICGKTAAEIDIQQNNGLTNASLKDNIRRLLGYSHPELSHLSGVIKALDENPNVYRMGFVNDSDLNYIYNLATAYCQPSYYEGFGIPVAEAMASGTPVVCAKTQALVEVADKSAVYFDPYDENDMAEKLSLVINDSSLRANMIREGLKKSQDYSWHKTTINTLYVYNQIQK